MTRTIGRYRIESRLGEGGMGVVHAAVDTVLGRRVALKTIHEGLGDETARRRLRREARAAAAVVHPGVCQVYDVGEEDGELYIAMELLEGESLAERLRRGALPMDEALDLALEVLDALAALHARGYVHRDIKPSNIFITPHGVKLLDFGLALPLESAVGEGGERLTMTGAMLGTPGFMAPEQWSGEAVGPAADLFAVGAVLFEALAGRPAFGGATPLETWHAIAREQPPALVGGPSVAAVDRLLQRALAKDPRDRPASAGELAAALRQVRGAADTSEVARARTLTRLVILPFRVLRPDDEIGFLCEGLPDAVATSLSELESLVVRSRVPAGVADAGDIAAVAKAAQVDRVVVGTILRAGSRVRVTVQLLEAPEGTVAWSEHVEADVRDLFELQDALTHRIVSSLSIPLSEGDERDLARARAATPEAQEYYLRANQLSYNTGMLDAARDLYRACVESDPSFAPAWARLGRVHRVMAKYAHGDVEGDYEQAEICFRRALELRPDLPIAHSLFTHFEIEQLADPQGAMIRLLGQAARHPADPDIFSGLVVACRFCGLLDASVAADQRARRLDPAVRTSVAYTYWMRGDHELAMRHDDEDMRYVVQYALALLGRKDEAVAVCRGLLSRQRTGLERNVVRCSLAALEGDREACVAAVQAVIASRFEDPEGLFHLARELAHVGATELALEILTGSVERGLHCVEPLERDPWLAGLRGLPEFDRLLDAARAGRAEAQRRYEAAGGRRLLGC